MTAFPYWIDVEEDVETARKFMDEHRVRHLPVKENGKLVGVISERDINRKLLALGQLQQTRLRVRDVCVMKAYVVGIDEPLDNVLVNMAMDHIGSAIIVKGERLAGMFTLSDACRAFADDLRDRFRPLNGNDAA